MISDWLQTTLNQHGLGIGVLAVFIGGLALNLTPCVYPMIPVTLAFFANQAAGAVRRTALLAFLYVAGISLSYAVLGVAAAATGALFGSWLQSPFILVWIAVAILALSLSMFGVYELRIPQPILNKLGSASAGLWGAFLMGLAVGLVAAPCVGPFLVGLMLFISRLHNPAIGFLLFFVLGLGMGVPSLVLALAANRIRRLPKAGEWLIWSKKALGIVLIGLAFYFVRPILPETVFHWIVFILLLAAGVYLGWLEKSRSRGGRFLWVRRISGVVLLVSALWVGRSFGQTDKKPGVLWQPFTASALEAALQKRQPVVVDTYADWCLPCVELDHVTFRNPSVIAALAPFAVLRIDVTREVSPDAEKLFDRYEVFGVPTVLLFDAQGREQKELRVLGFVEPSDFLERLKKLHP